jgi:nucleotide-binding universal stress UspA family protein
MYRRIIAAVNEFTNSEIAARYAISLAQSCRAQLSLIFVADDKTMKTDSFSRAESALKRLFLQAENQGIEAESVIESGDPLQKILEFVRKNEIDIAFTATRRQNVMKRFFVKSLSSDLMRRLPCSAAMVRAVRMGKAHPKDILVPLRGSVTHIEERAYFVAKLSQVFDAAVTVFHSSIPISNFLHGEVLQRPSEREQRIPEDVKNFIIHLNRYPIPHEKRTSHGAVARSITIEAARRRHDLIIMGASERSLFRSILGGNPVEAVLRETPCNLIILRPGRINH